jgi:hypothetical protein
LKEQRFSILKMRSIGSMATERHIGSNGSNSAALEFPRWLCSQIGRNATDEIEADSASSEQGASAKSIATTEAAVLLSQNFTDFKS